MIAVVAHAQQRLHIAHVSDHDTCWTMLLAGRFVDVFIFATLLRMHDIAGTRARSTSRQRRCCRGACAGDRVPDRDTSLHS